MPQSTARSGSVQAASGSTLHDETLHLSECIERVAHDLRSPICALRGFAYLLEQDFGDRLGEEGREYLDRLQSGVERVGKLVEELLEASKS